MQGPFSSALEPFVAHLQETGQCVEYVKESVRLKSSLGKIVNWGLQNGHEIDLARTFMALGPLSTQAVINGLFVTVIAAFEEFLRTTLVVAAKERGKRVKLFGELGEVFIKRHMEYSGRLLTGIHNPPTHPCVDYYDICRRLGTCLPDSAKFEINETALSLVPAVTELQSFFDCLRSLAFKLEWDDLGRDADLQWTLRTKGTRETSKQVREFLQTAVRWRNRIAHTGQAVADITEDVLYQHLDVFRTAATVMVRHLNGQ